MDVTEGYIHFYVNETFFFFFYGTGPLENKKVKLAGSGARPELSP